MPMPLPLLTSMREVFFLKDFQYHPWFCLDFTYGVEVAHFQLQFHFEEQSEVTGLDQACKEAWGNISNLMKLTARVKRPLLLTKSRDWGQTLPTQCMFSFQWGSQLHFVFFDMFFFLLSNKCFQWQLRHSVTECCSTDQDFSINPALGDLT